MSRLGDLRIVDPVLTSLARGYSNAEFIGDKLFPIAEVTQRAGKIPTFGKESFRVYDTNRALRADSNQMQALGIGSIAYATDEHDIEARIDYQEDQEAIFDFKTRATDGTMEALRLEHEKTCADIAQDDTLYAVTNTDTLTTDQFNDSGVDPVEMIEDYKGTLRGLIGKRPNAMFMGGVVFDALRNHTKILERIKYSSLGVVTLDLLKQVFGVKDIFVGESIYSTDGSTFTDIWQDNVILAYIAGNTGIAKTPNEPGFGYTLRLKGQPSVDTYTSNGGKIIHVRSTDNYVVKAVGMESAFLIKDVLGA
jgi:hypothetical protein